MTASVPRRVLIESPYHADTPEGIEANLAYLCCCIRDSLLRGEAPFASHLVYPFVFADSVDTERTMGIRAGLAWGAVAELTAVYQDRGISRGMQIGIDDAVAANRAIQYRNINFEIPRVAATSALMIIAARKHRAEIAAQVKECYTEPRRGGFTMRRGL